MQHRRFQSSRDRHQLVVRYGAPGPREDGDAAALERGRVRVLEVGSTEGARGM